MRFMFLNSQKKAAVAGIIVQRLCSRLTALWRYINFVLLLLLLLLHVVLRNFMTSNGH